MLASVLVVLVCLHMYPDDLSAIYPHKVSSKSHAIESLLLQKEPSW